LDARYGPNAHDVKTQQPPPPQFGSDGQPHTIALRPRLLERTNNLPSELTSLVGRTEAIAELRRLLVSARLLTLTGPGGIGKTRLALALGQTLLPDYQDGVWLVELAALADPALVAPTAAAAFGIQESGMPLLEHLAEVLGRRVMLVVLDNCEHVARGCAELADSLLRSCPGLQILATSRERLDVSGEVIWRVPGLNVPERGRMKDPLRQTEKIEAVQLFAERARAASGFRLGTHNSGAVTELCRQLEGIPLAIELAAGRTNVLTPQEIAHRVGDLFGVLIGGSRTAPIRQQTMRATLDWSYGLLSDSERTLFNRLSVFAGGWTLEAAEAVCADPKPPGLIRTEEVLELIGRLVDRSLVVAEPTESGSMRYRMLEPLRQYANERLRKKGEDGAVRARHRDWCLALAEAAWPALIGPDQHMWFVRLTREHDNLRAALELTLQEPVDAVPALRLAGGLHWFWWRHGHASEGRAWLARALELDDRLGTSREPAAQHARLDALKGAAILARGQGEYEAAETFCTAMLALAQEVNDPAAKADALYWGGFNAVALGDSERGSSLIEESLSLWRQVGDPWGMTWPLGQQVGGAASRGDYEQAVALG
jgi:predicted ATPase